MTERWGFPIRRAASAAALVSYLVLTVVFTRPLARAPASTIEWGWGDPLLVAYVLNWGAHALATGPQKVFNASFYFPARNTLSLSEHLLSVSWPFAPLALLNSPLLLYNTTVFASFALSAFAFFLYLRRVGCSPVAAWVGGILFGFTPWRYGQLGHAQLLYTWWIPLTLLAIEVWLERPRLTAALASGVCFALAFEASVYQGFFFALFLLGYLPARLVTLRAGSSGWTRLPGHAAAAVASAVLVLLPSFLAYRRMHAELPNVNPLESLIARGADVLDYVNPPSLSFLWGRFCRFTHPYSDVPWEMHAFPGAIGLAAILLVPALFLLRRSFRAPAIHAGAVPALFAGALVCLVVSFGPVLHAGGRAVARPLPYQWLHAHAPGFGALRVPARASFFVALAGAGLAAILVESLRLHSRRFSRAVLVLAPVVALLDVAPNALPYKPPLEYERLSLAMRMTDPPASDSGADLALPICDELNYAAPLASAPRFRPLVNGKSGYLLPENGRIFAILGAPDFGPAQADLLEDLNVTRLFLDRTRLSPAYEKTVLASLSGRARGWSSGGLWRDHRVVLLSWNRPKRRGGSP